MKNRDEHENIKLLWENSKPTRRESDTLFHDGLYRIKAAILVKLKRRRKTKKVLRFVVLMAVVLTTFFSSYYLSILVGKGPNSSYVFHRDSVGYIVGTLQRDYHIRIDVKPGKILSCTFTGTFYNEPVEKIIQSLSESLNLKLERQGKGAYKLTGEGCSDSGSAI